MKVIHEKWNYVHFFHKMKSNFIFSLQVFNFIDRYPKLLNYNMKRGIKWWCGVLGLFSKTIMYSVMLVLIWVFCPVQNTSCFSFCDCGHKNIMNLFSAYILSLCVCACMNVLQAGFFMWVLFSLLILGEYIPKKSTG